MSKRILIIPIICVLLGVIALFCIFKSNYSNCNTTKYYEYDGTLIKGTYDKDGYLIKVDIVK